MVAKKWFYGIYGIQFIWRGEWSDPELIWHGKSFNYFDIENPLWECYNEECEETGIQPNIDEFGDWVKKNAYLAREFCQNIIDARKAKKK